MYRKLAYATFSGFLLIASGPALAQGAAVATSQNQAQNQTSQSQTSQSQTSQNQTSQNQTCSALCDFFTTLKKNLSSQGQSAQTQQPATGAAASDSPAAKAAERKPHRRKLKSARRRAAPDFRIYASEPIARLDELQGQSVSLGLNGSRSQELARKALARAGVEIHEVPLDADNAFDALSIGAVKAIAVSGHHEYAMMDKIPHQYGVHRLELPSNAEARRPQRQKTAALTR